MGSDAAKDLIQALYIEILKVSFHPFPLIDLGDLNSWGEIKIYQFFE